MSRVSAIISGPLIPTSKDGTSDLLTLMLSRRSEQTRRAYEGDLTYFFASRGEELGTTALERICALRTGELAIALNEYLASMRALGLAAATINRRLSSVRSLLRLARRFGFTEVAVEGLVDNEPSHKYRDTSGPALDEVVSLLASPDQETLAGKRDYAILRLMWENAVRRGEISSLNIEDFLPGRKSAKLRLYRKGRGSEPVLVSLTKRCSEAISAYVQDREGDRGRLDNGSPLFANLSPASGARLSGSGLYYILRGYGADVLDRRLSPHQMRHASTTAFLDETSGDLRSAQALTGHADPRTLQIYDDHRADLQGQASETLSRLA